jgi:DNA polymerase-3 subunit epsilon
VPAAGPVARGRFRQKLWRLERVFDSLAQMLVTTHRQRSFDDLGTPLSAVTFVVLDLETTGGSPNSCAITEVGAVKFRGGELLATFQTLVNPGALIPPEITFLTGITQTMVMPAPKIEEVIGSFLRFVGKAVIVGHNVRFDLRFLAAATDTHGWPRLDNVVVDTCALARRLVRDEVPNCKLATLATHLRAVHRPTHRALDDAWATAEVLHSLLERAGSMGVLGLDDLVALPKMAAHPQVSKLKLTAALPRGPGVYLFRDGAGNVLYVGKAANLRRRVRSYFSSDDRRKVWPLLREVAAIDHVVCPNDLEAAVLEVRLIHRFAPRYNRRTKHWRRYAYLKLTLDERFPRLSVVKVPRAGDGCLYLGPLASRGAAKLVAEAIHTSVPLRRCAARPGRVSRVAPCTAAQLGVASCPCAGTITEADYGALVERVVRGLTIDPAQLLDPLAERMRALARAARFEEAADVRNRAAALARAVTRQHRLDALRNAGRLEIELAGEGGAVVEDGVLHTAVPANLSSVNGADTAPPAVASPGTTLPRQLADEVGTIVSWLEARANRVRVVRCEGDLAWPFPPLPSFEPVG